MQIKNLKTELAKTEADVVLKGIKIAFLKEGGTIHGVLLEDEDGAQVQIKNPGGYSNSLSVLIPERVKMKPVFTVKTTILGQPFERSFTTQSAADEARRALDNQFAGAGTVEKGEAPAEAVEAIDDSIPF